MTNPQRVLIEVLSKADSDFSAAALQLNSSEVAELYIYAAFLISSVQFLSEEHWLQSKTTSPAKGFRDFVAPFFAKELSPIIFLQSFMESVSLPDLRKVAKTALWVETFAMETIKGRSFAEQKNYASQALTMMAGLFRLESQLQSEKKRLDLHLGLSMYRTFDRMDELFNLNYRADEGMKQDLENSERLYEGAGVGVQSGYSTVLTALEKLQPSAGSRFIDLGSGYGRVGLVVGLMRPDLNFIGYEFVQHRVDIANTSTQNLGLEDRVHFVTQDLSHRDFQIPEAEIYYMYDPFSEDTYGHVLSQLIEISRTRAITIVTKGNARQWLVKVARRENWREPEEFDSGNLCLFRSA